MRAGSLEQAAGFYSGNMLLIDEPLCLNLRGRREWCGACAEACPAQALALSPDAVDLADSACTGCGACLPACPAGVLRMSGFSPRRLLELMRGQATVHLHCRESRGRDGGVVIPCHQVLDARLLAAAAAEGVGQILLHGLERCGQCDRGDGAGCVARERARLEEWLGERAPRVAPAREHERGGGERQRADQARLNRRDFLRLTGARIVDNVAGWMVPADTGEGTELPFHQGGEELQRPAAYQAVAAERVERIPWAAEALPPWSLRTLAESCSACLACGRRCPTGALRAHEEPEGVAISFAAALCTDCRLCERICPEQAVVSRPARTAAEVSAPRTRLLFRQARRCGCCGQPFQPAEEAETTCPTCRNEQELDAEWLAMLGE